MSQPPFWLKVSKKYVIENFESLLDYINRYSYSPDGEGQIDFEESVACLAAIAADLAAQCRQTKIWQRPDLETDFETAVRIMAASVLAHKKMGFDDHEGILNLIELLLSSGQQFTSNVSQPLLRLAIGCICHRPIEKLGFSFTSISKVNFIPGTFPSLLGATELGSDTGRRVEFEGKGCLEVSAGGIIAAPMNLDTYHRVKSKATLDGVEGVRIVENGIKRPSELSEIMEYYGQLGVRLDRVKPSMEKRLPKYSVGERMLAEVVSVSGLKNVMRTISPDYQTLEGKLYVTNKILSYIPREYFFSQLVLGDVFMVERYDEGDMAFTIDNEDLSEFMSEYFKELYGERLWAVYMRDFRKGKGTQWLTEEGFLVNVSGSVPEGIDTSGDDSEKVTLTMRSFSIDSRQNLILNAVFDEDMEIEVEDCDVDQFKKEAYEQFCASYLDWSKPVGLPSPAKEEKAVRIGCEAVVVVGRLLEAMADDPNLSTLSRVEHLTMSMVLLKMAGRDDDCAYVRHRLDYQRAIAEFASGASPISLELHRPEALTDVEESRLRDRIIERVRGYKELEITHADSLENNVPGGRRLSMETLEVIRQLIDASNILIDKIDSAEIHRIKKSIASRLGVADCYRNTYDGLPYYGYETETLEFKRSCALPPQDRRSTSRTRDLEEQKYAILKGVCAFLNSPEGGDLLVGVADSGYAVGLKDDIAILYASHAISEPTADRLRIYVKNAIDVAFTTVDGSMTGSAVTADCVSCNIESPRENIDLLRIHVKPYPWDVVRFVKPENARPEGYADVYSRTSGASTPMMPDGIRAIKLRKINELGRENSKLLPIMEAIDKHRCVWLRGYASSSGKSDREIEPYRLLFDQKAVQAIDLASRTMRLFKLHRASSVELSSHRWKCESLHRDFEVDIFGMMQSDESSGESVSIKISDYALSLLQEEYQGVGAKAEIVKNSASDRECYGWVLTTEIYHPAGIGRFILGLRREIEVIEGENLKEYLANY